MGSASTVSASPSSVSHSATGSPRVIGSDSSSSIPSRKSMGPRRADASSCRATPRELAVAAAKATPVEEGAAGRSWRWKGWVEPHGDIGSKAPVSKNTAATAKTIEQNKSRIDCDQENM